MEESEIDRRCYIPQFELAKVSEFEDGLQRLQWKLACTKNNFFKKRRFVNKGGQKRKKGRVVMNWYVGSLQRREGRCE